jgi:hypothetical protein
MREEDDSDMTIEAARASELVTLTDEEIVARTLRGETARG